MKRILLMLLIVIPGLSATSQTFPFNNEWIDYSKTYYKFYVGKTGLYRISQTVLASNGIGSIPAEQFQLWNDGLPDSTLYRDSSFILANKYSLQTDTAAFFLTINPAGVNRRLQNTVNNV